MSQTKTTTVAKGTTTRSNGTGAGASKRFYVMGALSGQSLRAYLQATLDASFWTNVGKINSFILTLYTDDGFGVLGEVVQPSYLPSILARRLTGAFTQGTSAVFASSDYTTPGYTSAGQVAASPSAGPLTAVQIDLTYFAELWAPATVKRRDGSPCAGSTNYGFALWPADAVAAHNWAAISEDAEAGLTAYKPVFTLSYEYGVTQPDVPTIDAPFGSVASFTAFEGNFSDVKTTDQLRRSEVRVYAADGTTVLYDQTQDESATAILSGHFNHVPIGWVPVSGVTYKWIARLQDQEGQWSPWSDQTTFVLTNTAPVAPTLTPSGSTYASLDGVRFKSGAFSDPDGDAMQGYQVQLSAYASGDSHWLDDYYLLWNSGKKLVAPGATSFDIPYGGATLAAGAYYWRARVYDAHGAASNWTYAAITLSAAYVVDPAVAPTVIQLRPRAPWRIVIRDMLQADGVTRTVGRGPGRTVAVLEDVYNPGASRLWNSPGECHWSMPLDHPQISVIEPKQTHYAVEMRQGDGWREVYAGLVNDFDSNDRDVVFYGIDYLGLLDKDIDTRYDPANPDKPAESGGSKYVTAGSNSIGYIIHDLLTKAGQKTNSLTGFITPAQSAATLIANGFSETAVCFSTYEPYLSFIAGLLDSHRAGTGKRSQLRVEKQADGSYKWVVDEDPGQVRDNLRLRYGELVQGFRVIPFGSAWASRVAAVGRDKNGTIVRYADVPAPGFDEAVWGRWATSRFFDGVYDANDFARKAKQAAVANAKLGRQIGVALREGALQPRDGYDIPDIFPVQIEKGSVSTAAMGSGYWSCVGITWTAPQQGSHNLILTLQPREDSVAPDSDLLSLEAISPQPEWQIGWVPPVGTTPSSRFFLDQASGKTYERDQATGVWNPLEKDPKNNNLLTNSGFEMTPIATGSTKNWPTDHAWTTATEAANLNTGGGAGALAMTTATY